MSGGLNFHGERRCNDTHVSSTDPEARMYRKSNAHPARLCYAGHVLMENRNALVVEVELTRADGTCERDSALAMLSRVSGHHPLTLGADKAYDTQGFVAAVRACGVTLMWRRIRPAVAARPSMRGPLGTQGMASARGFESASRRASAGRSR